MQTNDPFKFWALEFLLDLLEKGESLSAAAERFDLSVSGASRMLDKLRVHFNDPLFVVVSGRLQPTDFAINLGDRLRPIVAEIKSLRAEFLLIQRSRQEPSGFPAFQSRRNLFSPNL